MKLFFVIIILIFNGCNMKNVPHSYKVLPQSADGEDFSLYPSVKIHDKMFEVSLAVTRPPNQEILVTNDFMVELIADKKLEAKKQPNEKLTEVGGSLGTTTNVSFMFFSSSKSLKKLIITFKGKVFEFGLEQQ